jgi:hypothetical protein
MFRGRSAYFLLATAATVMGVAALLFLSPVGGVIFVLLMISFIGIPLAVVLSLIPPIALLLVLAAAIAWPFRRRGWPAVLLAFIPAGAMLFYAPGLLNAAADKEAQALAGADMADGARPFAGRSIAVFVPPTHSEECLDFCQRALVSGAVETFLVARSSKTWPEPDFDASGTAFRLVNRPTCDAVKIRDKVRDFPAARSGAAPEDCGRHMSRRGATGRTRCRRHPSLCRDGRRSLQPLQPGPVLRADAGSAPCLVGS